VYSIQIIARMTANITDYIIESLSRRVNKEKPLVKQRGFALVVIV
jgi:hypothetical protein